MTECWVVFLVLATVGLAQGAQNTLTPALSDVTSLADSSHQLWNQHGPQGLDLQDLADKRSWNSFHGSWGKRAAANNFHESWDKRDIQNALLDELVKQARWNKLHGSVDKRTWSQLRGTWGKRSDGYHYEDEEDDDDDDLPSSADTAFISSSDESMDEGAPAPPQVDHLQQQAHTSPVPHKRGWSLFSGSWLKRPQVRSLSPRSTNWSSLRGTWGKRSGKSNWSSLRGAWGKRGQDWSNFRGSWGKRDAQLADSSDLENM